MKTVEFNVEAWQDDTDVVGNAMCSGDDAFDKECEDHILADLDDGNVWAWASIKVTACVDGIECANYLDCCNYKDEADFLKDACYLDMKGEALSELRMECESNLHAIECAEKELAAEHMAYDERQARMECWRCPHCKDVVVTDPDCDDTLFCTDCDTEYDRYNLVDVVFLRDTQDGDVFAVFPSEAATVGNPSHMTCYVRVGGHSGAGMAYCEGCREVTDSSVYADLAAELDYVGYNLRVVRKDCMGDSKYIDSRLEQLKG